jgi:serine protease Do
VKETFVRTFPLKSRTAAILIAAVISLPALPAAAQRGAAPPSFADTIEKLLPSVVNISTTQVIKRPERGEQGGPGMEIPRFPPGSPFEEFFREFFDRQQRQQNTPRRATSLGSGFIIDPSGLIVTNNHVIAEADEVTVILQDDSHLPAKVIGKDSKTDLALLKVESSKPLAAVRWGDSDKSRVGDWVLAIGNPFGLGGSVTAGIVSARKRDIGGGPYDDFIQTDASINRGNSGGPMFNMDGEVIGINAAIYSPSGGSVGIGFAIPSSLAKPIVDQLKQFGRAKRGWIGVRIQTVTDELAQSLGLEKAAGALVAGMTEAGPAEKAKLLVGDVIVRFDNKPIDEMRRLPRIVAETEVGKQVPVEIIRKGKRQTLPIMLGEFPDDEKVAAATSKPTAPAETAEPAQATLGLTLAPITKETRQKFNLSEDVKGVIVTKVDEDSAAAEKGIRPGHIVRKIGPEQETVTTPAQVKKKIDDARKAKQKTILVLVESEGAQRFIALRLDGTDKG